MIKPWCGGCLYFVKERDWDSTGECRYNPPTVHSPRDRYTEKIENGQRWPDVHETDWCGRWQSIDSLTLMNSKVDGIE